MRYFKLTKKQKSKLIRIIVCLPIFVLLLILSHLNVFESAFNRPIDWLLPAFLFFALYVFIGYDLIINAVKDIFHLQITGESLLMFVATVGAIGLGIFNGIKGNGLEGFDEAVAVVTFFQVGQLFESIATAKSRESIKELLDICPDQARIIKEGVVSELFPEEVSVGDILIVYPGEKIPLDCILTSEFTTIDSKALTGESLPVEVLKGDTLLSGSINLTNEITCEVTKSYEQSTATKILDLIENASDKKSKSENFVASFARYYTPIVMILALLTAIIPPLFLGNFSNWIYRALSFLVVSCPCALVISVPMTYFVALGKASKARILVKGSCFLESLAKANHFVFDKTGTLTTGEFKIEEIYPSENAEEVLKLACIAERKSSHPLAKSIVSSYKKPINENYSITNFAGLGVSATYNNEIILCGSLNFILSNNIKVNAKSDKNAVYVAKNGVFVGYISLCDSIKSGVNSAIEALLHENCKITMLTGDNFNSASKVAKNCNITNFKANLLPQDKVSEVKKIMQEKGKNEGVCFVGDGINDAPVLTACDVGVAMGALGSDAAIESADVVLINDDLSHLVTARKIAKKASAIVKQNIVFSIAIKCGILVLSFFGITNMWISIFGDVGVAILAILNALRAK